MNDYTSRLVHLWNASYLSYNLKSLKASYEHASASLHLNIHYSSISYFYVALHFLSHYHIKGYSHTTYWKPRAKLGSA